MYAITPGLLSSTAAIKIQDTESQKPIPCSDLIKRCLCVPFAWEFSLAMSSGTKFGSCYLNPHSSKALKSYLVLSYKPQKDVFPGWFIYGHSNWEAPESTLSTLISTQKSYHLA